MSKTPDRIPFWKEVYLKVENDIGTEDAAIGLLLGCLVTLAYWKHCKK